LLLSNSSKLPRYFSRTLEKIIKKVNRKIDEYKRKNKFEFTLSHFLTEKELKIVAKHFKSLDRKVYLTKSSITETGRGTKRKWSFTSESFLDINEFPRPVDLTALNDDLGLKDSLTSISVTEVPEDDFLDSQEVIEQKLLTIITDFLVTNYPSSPQARLEILLNVTDKISCQWNPDIHVDLARESTLPQETILKLMRPIIKDHLEIQRATMGETKMLTKQRINKIAQLKISLTHLEDQEKNEIQTQKNYIEDYTNPRRLLLIGNVTNPCVIAY
jgi:hypothetical protein